MTYEDSRVNLVRTLLEIRSVPSLVPNIRNRVRKLPKPSTHAQGMQPIFEAVSNAIFAIEDRFQADGNARGKVTVDVTNLGTPAECTIAVTDNGAGFDDQHFKAFCTVDTDFKASRGGKGVGRLFWLDAFSSILIESAYRSGDQLKHRSFRFTLSDEEQVVEVATEGSQTKFSQPGTTVTFRGLRILPYQEHFPKRADSFLRHFGAHFIADFLVGASPQVDVSIDGSPTRFPQAISSLVVGSPLEVPELESPDFGALKLQGFATLPEASTGLDGNHQLHLLANGLTVESRKIDGLLGMQHIEHEGQSSLFFHACVSGEFLDERVNEGRTAFNIPETTLKALTRFCVDKARESALGEQVKKFDAKRRESFESFIERYPTFAFEEVDAQLTRLPINATTPEEFASGLVKYQVRRDENRQLAMEDILRELEGETVVEGDFSRRVIEAAHSLQETERASLAQHVVRRKLVLDLIEKLILRVRQQPDREDDYHLEKTLHSLLCPMRVRGDGPLTVESRSHDLWIIDERLAFTRAFSSDERLEKVVRDGGGDRPDILIWDVATGLGVIDPERESAQDVDVTEPLRKVMIVELKRPGRTRYQKAEDQIEQQIAKYLAKLKDGEIETYGREKVRIAPDCIFYCYVVADIEGDLRSQLSTWERTASGEGRIRTLSGEFRGMIEVVQWRNLINDAWLRNQAFLHSGGLRRR